MVFRDWQMPMNQNISVVFPCCYNFLILYFILRLSLLIINKFVILIMINYLTYSYSEYLHTRDPAIGTESLVKFKWSRTCLSLGESWIHPTSISKTKINELFIFFLYYCKSVSSNCVLCFCFPIVQCHYSFLHVYILKTGYYMLVPSKRSMFLCPCCLIYVVVQFK